MTQCGFFLFLDLMTVFSIFRFGDTRGSFSLLDLVTVFSVFRF